MPDLYAPAIETKEPFATFYQVFVGEATAFPPKEGVKFDDISDGRDTTILIAEGAEPVPWTKPHDLPYDPNKALPKLGGHFKEGIGFVIANGAVMFVPPPLNEEVLRQAITRNDGGSISLEDLQRPPQKK
jgi:hypothetical protein